MNLIKWTNGMMALGCRDKTYTKFLFKKAKKLTKSNQALDNQKLNVVYADFQINKLSTNINVKIVPKNILIDKDYTFIEINVIL